VSDALQAVVVHAVRQQQPTRHAQHLVRCPERPLGFKPWFRRSSKRTPRGPNRELQCAA
jgi:hypothetical protein